MFCSRFGTAKAANLGAWDAAYNNEQYNYGTALDDIIGKYWQVGKLHAHPVFKKDLAICIHI